MNRIGELTEMVVDFSKARGWERHHSVGNLAASISIEAGELMEHFQWDREGDGKKSEWGEELADVVMYCLMFAHASGLDISDEVSKKLVLMGEKYPVGGDGSLEQYKRAREKWGDGVSFRPWKNGDEQILSEIILDNPYIDRMGMERLGEFEKFHNPASILEKLNLENDWEAFFMELSGEPIGCLVRIEDRIWRFHLKSEYCRNGWGSRLFEEFVKKARSDGRDKLWLRTMPEANEVMGKFLEKSTVHITNAKFENGEAVYFFDL